MINYSVPYCNDVLKCTCMWTSQHVLAQVVIHLHKIRLMDDNIDTFVNKESIFSVILCVIGKKLLIPSPYLTKCLCMDLQYMLKLNNDITCFILNC